MRPRVPRDRDHGLGVSSRRVTHAERSHLARSDVPPMSPTGFPGRRRGPSPDRAPRQQPDVELDAEALIAFSMSRGTRRVLTPSDRSGPRWLGSGIDSAPSCFSSGQHWFCLQNMVCLHPTAYAGDRPAVRRDRRHDGDGVGLCTESASSSLLAVHRDRGSRERLIAPDASRHPSYYPI